MSAHQRSIAEVPVVHRHADVRWLVLELDEVSGGWFLFMHRDLDAPSLFDSWYPTREEAAREAATEWGVADSSDWRAAP